MISKGCFSLFLMISEAFRARFLSTFLNFFKKSKKLQNTVFYYAFLRFSHTTNSQNTLQNTTSKTNAPKMWKKSICHHFRSPFGSQNHQNKHIQIDRQNPLEKQTPKKPKKTPKTFKSGDRHFGFPTPLPPNPSPLALRGLLSTPRRCRAFRHPTFHSQCAIRFPSTDAAVSA